MVKAISFFVLTLTFSSFPVFSFEATSAVKQRAEADYKEAKMQLDRAEIKMTASKDKIAEANKRLESLADRAEGEKKALRDSFEKSMNDYKIADDEASAANKKLAAAKNKMEEAKKALEEKTSDDKAKQASAHLEMAKEQSAKAIAEYEKASSKMKIAQERLASASRATVKSTGGRPIVKFVKLCDGKSVLNEKYDMCVPAYASGCNSRYKLLSPNECLSLEKNFTFKVK